MPAEHWLDSRKSRTSRPPSLFSPQEQHLDVLPADVAHHIGVGHVAHRALHVGDGLDDVDVGPDRLLEHVRGVAGGAEPHALQRRPEALHVVADLGEDLLGVGDGVALGQGVGLVQHLARVVVHQHRLAAGGNSTVEGRSPPERAGPASKVAASKVGIRKAPRKASSSGDVRHPTGPAALSPQPRGSAVGDVVAQPVDPPIPPVVLRSVGQARRPPRRTPRSTGRFSGVNTSSWNRQNRRGPRIRGPPRSRGSACASTRPETAGSSWGPTEQQHLVPQGVAPGSAPTGSGGRWRPANEFMISALGMPDLTRLTMSVSANTPTLCRDVVQLGRIRSGGCRPDRGPSRP